MYRIVIGTAVLLLLASIPASGATLRVCFKCAPAGPTVVCTTVDVAVVPLYVDGLKVVPDLLGAGTSQADGSVCGAITPVPSAVKPGSPQLYTITGVNTIGQESAPSTALTFRFPGVPSTPTLVSVGATVAP